MPLKKSSSSKTVGENIKSEMEVGAPKNQEIAIVLDPINVLGQYSFTLINGQLRPLNQSIKESEISLEQLLVSIGLQTP